MGGIECVRWEGGEDMGGGEVIPVGRRKNYLSITDLTISFLLVDAENKSCV